MGSKMNIFSFENYGYKKYNFDYSYQIFNKILEYSRRKTANDNRYSSIEIMIDIFLW